MFFVDEGVFLSLWSKEGGSKPSASSIGQPSTALRGLGWLWLNGGDGQVQLLVQSEEGVGHTWS